tara:strand:- start:769 stop:1365 length:597 start_codon:yes stop_codon:yes gene_type:complete
MMSLMSEPFDPPSPVASAASSPRLEGVRVRPFESGDLETVKAITVEAFSGVSIDEAAEHVFGAVNGRDWKWRKARHIDADVARDVDGILVVESPAGEVIGYITTWQDLEAGIGYIPNLAFVPEWRGRGLGRMLIERALDRFRANGLACAKIETLAQNEVGHHLYTSIGFQEVARQVHFFADLTNAPSSGSDAQSEETG